MNAPVAMEPIPGPEIYSEVVQGPLGRALSQLDWESTSPSRGSFDRTWWAWKFSDFSAARFQEGIFTLAWLLTSQAAPLRGRQNARLLDAASAAVRFWAKLQHRDGSFDEAYPFERSLAATAFTSFYAGCGLECLHADLPPDALNVGLLAVERAARWLAKNGEYHGVLSNHIAAAAAALQIAGDVLGTDRFRSARNRYLGIVYANQDPDEGWLREYGGADPGYQSHAMFYLAEILRRSRDAELLDRLRHATDFIAWFAHPDGTLGGEYASRGTKFAYPAAFEMLASDLPAAAAVAAHLRRCMVDLSGVGAQQIDAWNLFPILNNYLFAANAASDLSWAPPLPWKTYRGLKIFGRAGLAIGCSKARVLVTGLSLGGVSKLWNLCSGSLIYEDCGYAFTVSRRVLSSQSASSWKMEKGPDEQLHFLIVAPFTGVPGLRFRPWRFLTFRAFTLTIGRLHLMARRLKDLLVRFLIRRRIPHRARLQRSITFSADGHLRIEDDLIDIDQLPFAIERHVPFHMGSARYADLSDWLGAEIHCSQPETVNNTRARRLIEL